MKLKPIKIYNLYVTLLLVNSLTFFSCWQSDKSNSSSSKIEPRQELAKKVVMNFLKDTLTFSDSLQIINFSQLDSSFTTLLDDSNYVQLAIFCGSVIDSFDNVYDKMKNTNHIYKNVTPYNDTFLLRKYLSMIDSANTSMTKISNSFEKVFTGWYISNQFKVKNAFNGVSVINGTYLLDSAVSNVVHFIDDYSDSKSVKDFKHTEIQREIFRLHINYTSLFH